MTVRSCDISSRRTDRSRQQLIDLLSGDLGFHEENSKCASHNFHSFPAKFPPQLPRKFINGLTVPGDTVLDPMMGSGTTIVEAYLAGRQAIGFDIDPLALRICRAKVSPVKRYVVAQAAHDIVKAARVAVEKQRSQLTADLANRWDHETKDFIDHWFAFETQLELVALVREIEKFPKTK